jgi:hypothetical protein
MWRREKKWGKALWKQIEDAKAGNASSRVVSHVSGAKSIGASRRSSHVRSKRSAVPLLRKRVPPVSAKRRRDSATYRTRRVVFLDGKRCAVGEAFASLFVSTLAASLKHCTGSQRLCALCLKLLTVPATDVHHTRGRAGPNYLDERTWKAVSREGHEFIERNPNAARCLGLLAERGKWNVPLSQKENHA